MKSPHFTSFKLIRWRLRRCALVWKKAHNILSLLWSTIWILGMLYTILIVEQNVSEYLSYPAFIAQRSEERGYIFPKIRICSNSMHSRWVKFKNSMLYNYCLDWNWRNFTRTWISPWSKNYMVSIWRTTKSRPTVEWKSGPKIAKLTRNFVIIWIPRVRNFYQFLISIFSCLALEDLENPPENLNFDLKDFFRKTRPTYQFVNCRLEFIDCRRMWEIVQETNIKNHDVMKNHFMRRISPGKPWLVFY